MTATALAPLPPGIVLADPRVAGTHCSLEEWIYDTETTRYRVYLVRTAAHQGLVCAEPTGAGKSRGWFWFKGEGPLSQDYVAEKLEIKPGRAAPAALRREPILFTARGAAAVAAREGEL